MLRSLKRDGGSPVLGPHKDRHLRVSEVERNQDANLLRIVSVYSDNILPTFYPKALYKDVKTVFKFIQESEEQRRVSKVQPRGGRRTIMHHLLCQFQKHRIQQMQAHDFM